MSRERARSAGVFGAAGAAAGAALAVGMAPQPSAPLSWIVGIPAVLTLAGAGAGALAAPLVARCAAWWSAALVGAATSTAVTLVLGLTVVVVLALAVRAGSVGMFDPRLGGAAPHAVVSPHVVLVSTVFLALAVAASPFGAVAGWGVWRWTRRTDTP